MPTRHSILDPPRARAALLGWFRIHARPLPWRLTRDPYKIWVSEVMLQQTRISTVIPYYRRFIQAFPSCRHLARARFERVAELWSGLGYYRRARHLHAAARQIDRDYGGLFPTSYEEACRLPGVGSYTASAILSIAYRQPYPAIDGNVARVIARLAILEGHVQQRAFRAAVEWNAERLISRREPGKFNQALMELGQIVCTPSQPACPRCPLKNLCRARLAGIPDRFPMPRPRRACEQQHLAAAVISKRGRFALIRGLDNGLLTDMWNFPAAFGKSGRNALARLKTKLRGLTSSPVEFTPIESTIRHGITHRQILVQPYLARVTARRLSPAFRWLSRENLDRAAVSQLALKIARAARVSEESDE